MLQTVITLGMLGTLLLAPAVRQLPRLGCPLDKQVEKLVTARTIESAGAPAAGTKTPSDEVLNHCGGQLPRRLISPAWPVK